MKVCGPVPCKKYDKEGLIPLKKDEIITYLKGAKESWGLRLDEENMILYLANGNYWTSLKDRIVTEKLLDFYLVQYAEDLRKVVKVWAITLKGRTLRMKFV